MPNDKEKLLRIMNNLEIDYRNGRISEEKYRYFSSKYQDKLNSLDAREATNRIRSMQGKSTGSRRRIRKPTNDNRREEQELVQKYIVNPKKGDKSLNQKEKKEMDSGTFKLVSVLILVIAFTGGIAFGIFNFDFESMSVVNAEAVVEDTAFPDVEQVNVTNTTSSSQDSSSSTSDTSSSSSDTSSSYSSSDTSSDGGSSNNGYDGGSSDPSGGSSGEGPQGGSGGGGSSGEGSQGGSEG